MILQCVYLVYNYMSL